MINKNDKIRIIDAVVNLQTPEALEFRPSDRRSFYVDKMNVDSSIFEGIKIDDLLGLMDKSGVEKAF